MVQCKAWEKRKKTNHGIHVLAHESKEIYIFSDELMIGLSRHVEFLSPLSCIGLGCDERNMYTKVIGVLHTSNQLLELILEILPALFPTFCSVFNFLKGKKGGEKQTFSDIIKLCSMVMARPFLMVYPAYDLLVWVRVLAADSYGTRDAMPSS